MATATSSERISFAQAAKLVPGNLNPIAIWRWAKKGIKLPSGDRIKLPYEKIGTRHFTTREALDEFLSESKQADREHFNTPRHRARPTRREIERREKRAYARTADM
jgi:hypothetical protein